MGWAVQPGERTVEGELRAALATVLREPVALTVAGRTDRGVHALGQVVSYEGPLPRLRSVNALLPPEISVLAAERGPGRLLRPPRRPQPRLPLPDPRAQRALAVRARPRALAPVSASTRPCCTRAPRCCAGTHDFTAFTPTDGYHRRFERDVLRAGWERHGDVLELSIEADSFMRNMNRVLVGTMLELAGGRRRARRLRAPARGPAALGGRPHRARHGLYLVIRSSGTRLESDAAGAAHQRRRDRREGPADAAARAAGRRRRRARRRGAGLQPLGDRALDHLLAPAVGHRGRRSRTAPRATPATAPRSTASGSPRSA